MNKITLIILTIFLINIVNAQQDTLETDSCKCKNEFSLNVIPVFSEIMVGDVEYQKFDLIYKRRIKNGAIRIQGFYMPEFSYFYPHDQLHYSNFNETKDSTETLRTYLVHNISSYCFGGAIGYEWQKKRKNTERFIGFDISYGINALEYNIKISEWSDNTKYAPMNADTSIYGFYEKAVIGESKLKTQVMRIGINPFYGWKVMVENQFSIAVQFGPDFGFNFGNIAIYEDNNTLKKKAISEFYFSRFFLNDVSVIFKF